MIIDFSVGQPRCPVCDTPIMSWPGRVFGGCTGCRRPLFLVKASGAERLYRIVPLFDYVRLVGSILAAFIFLAMFSLAVDLIVIVRLIVLTFMVFGSAELVDGVISCMTRTTLSLGKRRQGRAALFSGLRKVTFGAACVAMGIYGGYILSQVA